MEVLSFPDLVEATFLDRPNRFTARALLGDEEVLVHVRDSGRMGELLLPGTRILLRKKSSGLPYELIAVFRENYGWVFTNSGYHSRIAETLIQSSIIPEFQAREYRKEVPLGESRIDFLLGSIPLEVKGCTLFQEDACLFPDAPTERGRRHLHTLMNNTPSGLLFLTFNDRVRYVSANDGTDPDFASTIVEALERGVHVWALRLHFDGRTLRWTGRIPFIYPREDEIFFLREAIDYALRSFPGELTSLWLKDKVKFNILFHEDVSQKLLSSLKSLGIRATPLRSLQFNGGTLVTYELLQ